MKKYNINLSFGNLLKLGGPAASSSMKTSTGQTLTLHRSTQTARDMLLTYKNTEEINKGITNIFMETAKKTYSAEEKSKETSNTQKQKSPDEKNTKIATENGACHLPLLPAHNAQL